MMTGLRAVERQRVLRWMAFQFHRPRIGSGIEYRGLIGGRRTPLPLPCACLGSISLQLSREPSINSWPTVSEISDRSRVVALSPISRDLHGNAQPRQRKERLIHLLKPVTVSIAIDQEHRRRGDGKLKQRAAVPDVFVQERLWRPCIRRGAPDASNSLSAPSL